jgi:hypothetical protein
MRSWATRMNQISCHWEKLVPSKTSTCLEGFQYKLAHMFTIMRWSVTCTIQVPKSRSHIGVKVKIKIWSVNSNHLVIIYWWIEKQMVIIWYHDYGCETFILGLYMQARLWWWQYRDFVQSIIISYIHGRILIKLHRNLNPFDKLCQAHEPSL